jgi:signal transduction histidine kinase
VALSVNFQLARLLLDSDPAAAGVLLDEIAGHVREALDGVRELARSIYPSLLDRGLREALSGAAYEGAIPARVDVADLQSHPPDVEAAVYFVCVEGLADAASRASVRAWTNDGVLGFEVIGDGIGRAGPTEARDRLEALGGEWELAASNGGSRLFGRYPRSAR